MLSPPIEKPAAPAPRVPVLRRKCECGASPAPRGPCPGCEEAALRLQPKLEIGAVDDPLEREADRIADAVFNGRSADFSRVPVTVQRRSAGARPAGAEAPASVHRALAEPGRPLDAAVRRDLEPRFGCDFSQVRVHDGAAAGRSALEIGASAYAVGSVIAFAPGRYAPSSKVGRRLLAHELTHVAQQGLAEPMLRRQEDGGQGIKKEKYLQDYNDEKAKHDPGRLTDAEIEQTVEFKAFMSPSLAWQTKDKVTHDEALLACRLMLRQMREGKDAKSYYKTQEILLAARKQLGVLKTAQSNVGKFDWVPFEHKLAAHAPEQMQSDFGRWLLAKGAEPDAETGKVNCWEMVLFSAFQAEYVSKDALQTMYVEGMKLMKERKYRNMGECFEAAIRGSGEKTWDPKDPNTPEPLPGDIVIFDKANTHVAISLGTKEKGGSKRHHIISHGLHPDRTNMTKRTTIEELLPYFPTKPVVKFWSPNWSALGAEAQAPAQPGNEWRGVPWALPDAAPDGVIGAPWR